MFIPEELDESDVEVDESDNRKLRLEATQEIDDGFLGHLTRKYTTGTLAMDTAAPGRHVLTAEGPRVGDYELWEVPTQVRQEI